MIKKGTSPVASDASLPAQMRTVGYLLRELYGNLQRRVYAAAAAAGHPDLRDAHSSVLRHLDPQAEFTSSPTSFERDDRILADCREEQRRTSEQRQQHRQHPERRLL